MKILKYSLVAATILIVTAALFASCMHGGKLDGITITPATTTIARGTTQQFTATAHFSDGTSLTWTTAVEWGTHNPDGSVNTVDISVNTSGLVTATSTTGTFTITATDKANNITGTAVLTVVEPLSIAITPANPIMAKGATHSFIATATLTDIASGGSTTITQNLTSFATWTTSDSTIADVVTNTGFVTAATTTGTTSLIATVSQPYSSNTLTATTKLTITADTVNTISVTPDPAFINLGAEPQWVFTVTGTYPDLTTQIFTDSVTWSSSNIGIAQIDNSTGLVTIGTTTGSTDITATDPITGKSGHSTLIVQ